MSQGRGAELRGVALLRGVLMLKEREEKEEVAPLHPVWMCINS